MKYTVGIAILLFMVSCDKSEGEGGNSSISGIVNLEQYNSTFTVEDYTAAAADYDVYIVYGDEPSFSDKTETDYKGEYYFPYLRTGDYTLYVYSKVNSTEAINGLVPDEEALIQEVSLGKNEDLTAETFTVLNN